jgi:urease accessory protein
MHAKRLAVAAFAPAMLLPALALAHTGAGPTASLVGGIAHPLLGLDHLLAMLAVGVWAGARGGHSLWAIPAAFLAAMIGGGILGAVGATLPLVEFGIIGSVIALGVLIAANAKLAAPLGLAVIALFGAAHGHAHGAEMPAAGGLVYGLGFILATAALHLLGAALGRLASGGWGRHALRVGGGATALAGLALLIAG